MFSESEKKNKPEGLLFKVNQAGSTISPDAGFKLSGYAP
jgi:hypothetical protein